MRIPMRHPVALRLDARHDNWQGLEILLTLEVAIHGQECSELTSSQGRQRAVLDA